MKTEKGFNKILSSIGSSLKKEYTTDGGKANMQLVVFLVIIFVGASVTEIPEYITNYFLAMFKRPTIEFLPTWMLPVCFLSMLGVGIWCVSRISKIEQAVEEKPEAINEDA